VWFWVFVPATVNLENADSLAVLAARCSHTEVALQYRHVAALGDTQLRVNGSLKVDCGLVLERAAFLERAV
jgi:hypothetical protein